MRSTHALLRPVLVMGLVLFTALVALNPFFGTGEAAASDHILYVDANVVGGAQDGSSWADAFADLQDALAAAQNDSGIEEIWVAAGVYKPTNDASDQEATFQLLDGVALYGGFAGDETERDQREWETNVTVLSGDINGDDNNVDANGVTPSAADIIGANSFHVVRGSGVDATAVLDGFTIAPVQVQIAPVNPALCAVTPPLAAFTPETWQTPILFTVHAVAHQPTTVDCEFVVVVTSDDPDYDGLAAPTVTVSVASPQIPGLSLTTGVYLAGAGTTCASDAPATLTVETGSQVVFCFVVGNTGEAMLAIHSLSGNLTGPVFTNLNQSLAPGAGYTHTLTRTVTVNEVHQFEWNAVAAPGSTNGDTAAVAQVGDAVEVSAQAEVTLAIETPTSLPSENQPTVPGFRLLLPGVARD